MLKVLIADDERVQREGILKHIHWQDFNMQVVATAADGLEALDLAKVYKPDILITDIKMPYKDGIQLSRDIKEFLPKIKILIITGYEEFEYARAAVDLKASAFIMKPVDLDKMEEQLAQISGNYLIEQQSEREIAELRKQMEESIPVLVRQFIDDLLSGAIKDYDAVKKKAEFLKVEIPDSSYYVLFLEVEVGEYRGEREEARQLLYLELENHITYLCKENENHIILRRRDGEYVMVIFDADNSADVIYKTAEGIRAAVESKIGRPTTIGISNSRTDITELSGGFKEAQQALGQKFYLGSGKSILFCDIGIRRNLVFGLEDRINELGLQISIGNSGKAGEIIDNIFSELSSAYVEEGYVKTLCYSIVSCIHRILYEMDEKVERIFGEEDVLWDKIHKFNSIPNVMQWLRNIVTVVATHIYQAKREKSTGVVDTIKRILEEKYFQQITIEDISKLVYLTPNYVCNLFKDKTGEGVIDYLTRVRMEKAKKLLENEDVKIFEVAEKTGYNSTSYFSIVFKNTYGMSPKEYRNKVVEGK